MSVGFDDVVVVVSDRFVAPDEFVVVVAVPGEFVPHPPLFHDCAWACETRSGIRRIATRGMALMRRDAEARAKSRII